MSRFLLALYLFAFAAAAMANNTAANGVKPGKATAVSSTQDSDAAATGHPAAAPARSSTPRTVSPRWHSLLPGMIR